MLSCASPVSPSPLSLGTATRTTALQHWLHTCTTGTVALALALHSHSHSHSHSLKLALTYTYKGTSAVHGSVSRGILVGFVAGIHGAHVLGEFYPDVCIADVDMQPLLLAKYALVLDGDTQS